MSGDDTRAPAGGGKTLNGPKHFVFGIITGVLQAVVFNPYDRALYLAVKHDRPFLSRAHFSRPFHGFEQAIVQRALSAGLYFPLEDQFRDRLRRMGTDSGMAAGMCAGAVNGALLNGLATVKFEMWGAERARLLDTAKRMLRVGSFRPFLKGMGATVTRDMVFGMVFGATRSHMKDMNIDRNQSRLELFAVDALAAGGATVFSSPFNFVRNIKYATPPHKTPRSSYYILQKLWDKRPRSLSKQYAYFQNRLMFGWGTLRVALGMGFTSQIYSVVTS